VASYEVTGDGAAAEIALAVADGMHRRGIATLLLEHLVSVARARGVKTFVGEVLPDNYAVLRVLSDAGLAVRRRSGSGVIDLFIPLPQNAALGEASAYLDAVADRDLRADVASLEPLLAPRSAAVIGAGRRAGSIGRIILLGIRDLAVRRFAAFLASPAVTVDRLAQVDRPLLERYLAHLHAELAGRTVHWHMIGQLNLFFTAIRQHGWDSTLPTNAMFFPEDFPKEPQWLPRALSEHWMAQLERSDNLSRWNIAAYQLVTLILMGCGLRITDALGLPGDCLVRDANGAPYLRYYNHKMKREALVPVDEELERAIGEHRQHLRTRWPEGTLRLFPKLTDNPGGQRPVGGSAYRRALRRWLERCDIRDEHGQPVHLTPHHWRHTLGTQMKMGRIASDASFGSPRGHALPAVQRAALPRTARPGARDGGVDLRLRGRSGSDATMMRQILLRRVHHRRSRRHCDASGGAKSGRMHQRPVPGEWCLRGAAGPGLARDRCRMS